MKHIDTKSRFNTLTLAEQAHIITFLNSSITEQYVKVTQHDCGTITLDDYQECEFNELTDKHGYVKRSTLLKKFTVLDSKDFTFTVDSSNDYMYPTITACDGTVFRVRHDDVEAGRVYFYYTSAFFREGKDESLFDVVNRVSGGAAKLSNRDDKIKERHAHDVKHGSTATLSQYQEATSHDNLRDLYIETEGSIGEHELNYSHFHNPVWSMTKANTTFYRGSSVL